MSTYDINVGTLNAYYAYMSSSKNDVTLAVLGLQDQPESLFLFCARIIPRLVI